MLIQAASLPRPHTLPVRAAAAKSMGGGRGGGRGGEIQGWFFLMAPEEEFLNWKSSLSGSDLRKIYNREGGS